jgi:hypothetical protein
VRLFCTDDWPPYDAALPEGRHYIGKDQTQLVECLAVERYWDQARWAIMAYAWRFDGLGRAPRAGGTA